MDQGLGILRRRPCSPDPLTDSRQEDALDELGRPQPILIESESPLVERLDINRLTTRRALWTVDPGGLVAFGRKVRYRSPWRNVASMSAVQPVNRPSVLAMHRPPDRPTHHRLFDGPTIRPTDRASGRPSNRRAVRRSGAS